MGRSSWLDRDLVGDTSAHECSTRLWFAAAARTTLRDPRGAIASLLALAIACFTGIPGVLLAIPAIYALRCAVAVLDKRARRAALLEARALPIDLPSPLSFSDERARSLVERLERVRRATESAILSSPCGAPFALAGLLDEVPQLERDVVVLAARVEYLGRFLSDAPSAVLLAEIARLRSSMISSASSSGLGNNSMS